MLKNYAKLQKTLQLVIIQQNKDNKYIKQQGFSLMQIFDDSIAKTEELKSVKKIAIAALTIALIDIGINVISFVVHHTEMFSTLLSTL